MLDNLRLAIARALIPSKYEVPNHLYWLIDEAERYGADIGHSFDVNIDLETWGLTPGSAIRAIGAYATAPSGKYQRDNGFSVYIHDQSCIDAGLKMDPGTVKWWEDQSEKAKDQFLGAQKEDLLAALTQLNEWITKTGYDQTAYMDRHDRGPITVHVWGNGAVMDIALLEAAYRAVDLQPAWEWWASQDCRTMERLARQCGLDFRRCIPIKGEPHVALNDARVQGKRMYAAQQSILALVKLGKALM